MRKIIVSIILVYAQITLAQVPQLINYQGRLLNGTNLVSGTVGIELRLFSASSGGTSLYADSNQVAIVDGLYATMIGDNTVSGSLANALTNAQLWVETVVNGSVLSPRERVASVAFAMMASAVSTGAITTAMLADGVVTSNKLAPGLLGGGAPDIRAGQIDFSSLPVPTGVYFAAYDTGFTNTFSPSFAATPVVSLSLQSSDTEVAQKSHMYVKTKSTNAFSAIVNVPVIPVLVDHVKTNLDHLFAEPAISLAEINGKPAVAYAADFNPDNFNTRVQIYFASAVDTQGTSWNPPMLVVSSSVASIVNPNVALSSINGNPAIAYISDDYQLTFRRATDASGTSWGSPVRVSTNTWNFSNLQLMSVNGSPAITGDGYGSGIFYIRASDTNGTSWGSAVTLITTNGSKPDMAMIATHPAIAYSHFTNGVYYVRAGLPDGSLWPSLARITTNDTASNGGLSLSAIYTNPAIAYRDLSTRVLWTRSSDALGNSWQLLGAVFTNGSRSVHLGLHEGRPFVMSRLDSSSIAFAINQDYLGRLSWLPFVLAKDGLPDWPRIASVEVIQGQPAMAYMTEDANNETRIYFLRNLSVPSSQVNWMALEP